MNQDNAVAEALERLAALATPGPWKVDGEPHNQIIWSSPEDRVCFMAHSDGKDVQRDVSTADLIVELVNNLPTIIAALKARRVDEGGVS